MRTIAFANQKGGVGKTTTVQNVGVGLAALGKKVLLVDLDAQGNLTDACGADPDELDKTVSDLMEGKASFEEIALSGEALDLIPCNVFFADADIRFASAYGRENLLKKALKQIESRGYDYILMDCPPNLGLVTLNAFTAAKEIIIPVQCEYHALNGLNLIQKTYDLVKENGNPDLEISGIIATFYDKRKVLNREVLKELKKLFGEIIFETKIRDNVSLAEAPSHGKDIFQYSPDSFGAEDYRNISKEIISRMA